VNQTAFIELSSSDHRDNVAIYLHKTKLVYIGRQTKNDFIQ